MSAVLVLLATAAMYLLGTLAWWASRKAKYHEAKAEVYQEFADTFSAMGQAMGIRDKVRRKREQQRHWMRLILCSPESADALRDALADGDAYWNRTADSGSLAGKVGEA